MWALCLSNKANLTNYCEKEILGSGNIAKKSNTQNMRGQMFREAGRL